MNQNQIIKRGRGGRRGNPNRRRNNFNRRRQPYKLSAAQHQYMLYTMLNHTRIPRSLGGNIPTTPQKSVIMEYDEPNVIVKDPLNSFLVKEWKINDVYDMDPLVGGGSASGYTPWMMLYGRNLVTHVTVSVKLTNVDPGDNVIAYVMYRDVQPSTVITSYAAAQSGHEVAPRTDRVELGVSSGMSQGFIPEHKIRLGDILGRPIEYLAEPTYTGQSNVSPSNFIWMALVMYTYSPIFTFTNGVTSSVNIKATVNLFSGQRALETRRYELREQRILREYREAAIIPCRPDMVPVSEKDQSDVLIREALSRSDLAIAGLRELRTDFERLSNLIEMLLKTKI